MIFFIFFFYYLENILQDNIIKKTFNLTVYSAISLDPKTSTYWKVAVEREKFSIEREAFVIFRTIIVSSTYMVSPF